MFCRGKRYCVKFPPFSMQLVSTQTLFILLLYYKEFSYVRGFSWTIMSGFSFSFLTRLLILTEITSNKNESYKNISGQGKIGIIQDREFIFFKEQIKYYYNDYLNEVQPPQGLYIHFDWYIMIDRNKSPILGNKMLVFHT